MTATAVLIRTISICTLLLSGPAHPDPYRADSLVTEVAVGQSLPDTALQGLNGRSRKLSEFFGKPLIINVWASWCGPCRAEMASLERLAKRKDVGSFTVIGISTDDYRDAAMALLTNTDATITHFLDYRLRMERMLGASRLPLTVLVDADGHIVSKITGARQWDSPAAQQRIAAAFRQ